MYLRSAAPTEGEQPDSDLRELEFKKSQYGAMPDTVVLRYQSGMFVPVEGAISLDKEAQLETAKKVFLTLLAQYKSANRTVSDKSGRNYAPALFAEENEAKAAGAHTKILTAAMLDLFKERRIWNEPYGKASRGSSRIARAPAVRQQTNEISEHDTILLWAQACVTTGSITGTKTTWSYLTIGQPITSELIYGFYSKHCKKLKLRPEEEPTFNKICEEMFGPPKQISPEHCINYTKNPTNFLGYDVPSSSKWQQIIVDRLQRDLKK